MRLGHRRLPAHTRKKQRNARWPDGHRPGTRAKDSDQQAWDALVGLYAPLVWSVCRRYRLGRADAEDVGQTVWLRLVDQLDRLRDPDALPGWLTTTTRRQCLRILDTARRTDTPGPLAAEDIPDQQAAAAEEELLAAERRAALREAFTGLLPHYQRLLGMLIQDPPVSYTEISARLGISIGSIGPIRRRCLARLRRHPAIAALITAETGCADTSADSGPIGVTRRPPSKIESCNRL
jgi:RNA polymerase sigma factor (sigma-70 family)